MNQIHQIDETDQTDEIDEIDVFQGSPEFFPKLEQRKASQKIRRRLPILPLIDKTFLELKI